MANTNLTHSDVKSICDNLECSPSQHDSTSNYGGQAKLIRHAAGEQYHGGGHTTGGEHTSELQKKSMKSVKVPGYTNMKHDPKKVEKH